MRIAGIREAAIEILGPLASNEATEATDATEGLPPVPPTADNVETYAEESQVYLANIVTGCLLRQQRKEKALLNLTKKIVDFTDTINRRSMDVFAARAYSYYSLSYERLGGMGRIRKRLLQAYRSACIQHNEIGQATLLNLVLRDYIHFNMFDQAVKLWEQTKSSFPAEVSNNQLVRYLYYLGRVHCVQLNYSQAYAELNQAMRKVPANTCIGFRLAVSKLIVIVQLLMGQIPERSHFNEQPLATHLVPYLQLTQAVRVGNLSSFGEIQTKFAKVFEQDKNDTLIQRLRFTVIKVGLRNITLAYSRISFADICKKLNLGNPQDAEFICAKTIRDGVINAVIDKKNNCLQSRENVDLYSTLEPRRAFHERIEFCLDLHNSAVKAMRYAVKTEDDDATETKEEKKEDKKKGDAKAESKGDKKDAKKSGDKKDK